MAALLLAARQSATRRSAWRRRAGSRATRSRCEAEETITWPRGEIATERWHRRSDDGKTDAWFWLAPSLHYIPIKMRVTRTSRGTLEVLLDSIRVDGNDADGSSADANDPEAASEPANANPSTVDDITYGMPGSPMMPPIRAEDLRGQ